MSETTLINVVNPDGELVALPSNMVKEAVSNGGYKIPTAQEQKEFNLKKQYSGGIEQAKAGVEGGLRGLTFGASDIAETGLGISTPEAMAARKEYNPGTALGTEIAGAILPTFLAPEAKAIQAAKEGGAALSAAQKVAQHLPISYLGRGAKAIEHGVEGIAGKAAGLFGEGTLAARGTEAAGKIAAKGLAGAAEGAAFGAGETLTEDALGNPEPIGERLLANMGHGAMWGAGIGGLIGAGESAIPKAASGVKSAISKTYETLLGKEAAPIYDGAGKIVNAGERELGLGQKAYAKGYSEVTGKPIGEVEAPFKNPEEYKVKSEAERQEHIGKAKEDMENLFKEEKKLTSTVFQEVKPKVVTDILKESNISAPNNFTSTVISKLDDLEKKIVSDPDQYFKGAATKINEVKEGVLRRIKNESSAADHFNEIDSAKGYLQSFAKSLEGKDNDKIIATLPLLQEVNGFIRSGLEDSSMWGDAAAVQQKINRAYSELKDAKTYLLKSIGERDPVTKKLVIAPTKLETFYNGINKVKGQQTLDRLNGYKKALEDFAEASSDAHKVAKIPQDKQALVDMISKNYKNVDIANKTFGADKNFGFGRVTDWTSRAFGLGLPLKIAEHIVNQLKDPGVFAATLGKIHKTSETVGDTVEKLAKKAYEPIIKAAESSKEGAKKVISKEDVEKDIKNVKEKMESVDKTHEKLENSTKQISGFAPKITSAIQRSMLQGVMFLHSKIPDWSDNTSQAPMDAPKQPKQEENTKWARYNDAVEDPMSVMADAVNGRVTPEGIETLNTVYPNLYTQMKSSLINEIVSKKAKNKDITIPYQKRIAINQFLGVNLDSTLNPMNVMANQAIMNKKQNEKTAQENTAMLKPSQKGLSNINIASRSETDQQKSSRRNNV